MLYAGLFLGCSFIFIFSSHSTKKAHFPKCRTVRFNIYLNSLFHFLFLYYLCKMGLVDLCCVVFQVLLSHISAHLST